MQAPQRIYMVGIGGIGMSALAQFYTHRGARVSGSDRDASPTTAMLKEKNISVIIGQQADNVPEDAEFVVYSDAVPQDHAERARAREMGIPEMSYFEALGEVAKGHRTVAIAGTHGKTTTTAMLAKILIDGGADPTVIVGSIVAEWGSNFRAGGSDLFVVEACEYRNHFLVFDPEVLVITNLEWDHTDFFKDFNSMKAAFDEARTHAKRVVDSEQYKKENVPELLVPGEFNKENARAAKAAAKVIEPSLGGDVIDAALAGYRGTWRRFEYKGVLPDGALLYDDYAHHPTAIRRTITAAREKFPGKRIVVVFHPHLYSRTRDLFGDFAAALASADEALVLPVYAAREAFDPSVSNEALAEAIVKMGTKGEALASLEEATERMRRFGDDTVVFTMGAGDVYKAGEAALKAETFTPAAQ